MLSGGVYPLVSEEQNGDFQLQSPKKFNRYRVSVSAGMAAPSPTLHGPLCCRGDSSRYKKEKRLRNGIPSRKCKKNGTPDKTWSNFFILMSGLPNSLHGSICILQHGGMQNGKTQTRPAECAET